jgi:hypothetical protein
VLEQAEARAAVAEQEAATEREQRQRVMDAAAKGNLQVITSPGKHSVVPYALGVDRTRGHFIVECCF